MAEDLVNTIMNERIDIGFAIIEDQIKKRNLKVTDFEKADLAIRVANALFIEKNKAFRSGQIEKREGRKF
jgi:hypothetical protein